MQKKTVLRVSLIAFISCGLCVSLIAAASSTPRPRPSGAKAAEDKLIIHNAWIREMPASRRITAAYMVIENQSGQETALIGAKTDAAETVELHRMAMEGGMMKMQKIDRIKLPVGKTEVTGNFHMMLIGLKSPLKEGDQVKLTLQFEKSVSKTVTVPVKKQAEK